MAQTKRILLSLKLNRFVYVKPSEAKFPPRPKSLKQRSFFSQFILIEFDINRECGSDVSREGPQSLVLVKLSSDLDIAERLSSGVSHVDGPLCRNKDQDWLTHITTPLNLTSSKSCLVAFIFNVKETDILCVFCSRRSRAWLGRAL